VRRRVKLRFLVLAVLVAAAAGQQFDAGAAPAHKRATLWIDPHDIPKRDLYYGPGGREDQPQGPLTFVEEDRGGTSPKFDVRDQDGRKWKAKLGLEPRPETVAVRLLWAVGFLTNENYFLAQTSVRNLAKLHRGQEFVHGGQVIAVRLQRPLSGKKVGNWDWRRNPFKNDREFNGLRVMMALLSNWDLKQENNAVVEDHKTGDQFYEVSDLGASFGRSGKSYSDSITKNNLPAYRRSRFISKVTPTYVDFAFPTHPPFLYVFNLPFFISKMRTRWIGKHIPREDVEWIAGLLGQLSAQQIQDAFRAAGYSPTEITDYTSAVRRRITELQQVRQNAPAAALYLRRH
jgi:hypothetical protein